MKNKRFTMLAAAVSVLLPFAAQADSINPGIVTADVLNVRTQPSTDSAILGQIPNGSTVLITDVADNWYKIEFGDYGAYVHSDYVKLSDGTMTNLSIDESTTSPSVSDTAQTPENVPSYENSEVSGEKLVEAAKQYIGTPYVYGGSTPAGFDCSGFVKYCYGLFGVELNRVANDQAKNGREVSREEMKAGDILCFESSPGSGYIGHTGIYVGNGYFIHSPRTGYNVEIIPLSTGSYSDRLANIRRIFD